MQGCLKPIKTLIPRGCLLDPSDVAAVVGGNVLTSQRIVDVILLAFGVCAASQGCTNNITFGDEKVRQCRTHQYCKDFNGMFWFRPGITKQLRAAQARGRRGTVEAVFTPT